LKPATNTYKDQLGREVSIPYPPRRIISLVPSQTELLYDLGLDEEVVGITKFCIHPDEWFRTKTRIGGTKQLHLEQILALQPDLVIANKEENTQEQVEYLMQRVPVWVSDVRGLGDARNMIRSIGEITGKSERADEIAGNIWNSLWELREEIYWEDYIPLITAYFIWREPWMIAGGGTFIDVMLPYCGLYNAANISGYPIVDFEQLKAAECKLVLLSSEPYPFKEKHIAELQALLPQVRIELVDGEMFSWYGSRLLKSAAYFRKLWEQLKDTPRIFSPD
jgi:ABC-type Fe3+-hydroxamate transport system substrate-binding protein